MIGKAISMPPATSSTIAASKARIVTPVLATVRRIGPSMSPSARTMPSSELWRLVQ